MNKFLWQARSLPSGEYTTMKTPSYKINWEDLDSNSYRSVNNGNLIRNIVSKKWLKASFSYTFLEENEVEEILDMINFISLCCCC